jgi:hypothetical protein
MSKQNHPAYGDLATKPHTKTKITYNTACQILENSHLTILKDLAFGDSEYQWYDDNNKHIAEGYLGSSVIDIYFMDYTVDAYLSLNEKLYMFTLSKTKSIHRNDSQGE